jgi:hypothetical protein
MSADTNTGASLALVITDIYSAIQKTQFIYDDFNNKLGQNSGVEAMQIQSFFGLLAPRSTNEMLDSIRSTMPNSSLTNYDVKNGRDMIVKLICKICADMKSSEDAENKLYIAQIKSINLTRWTVTFLFAVFIIIILITLMYSVKNYISVDTVEVVKITLIFLLIIIVVTTLYHTFMWYQTNQKKQITSLYRQSKNRFQVYKDYLFGHGQDPEYEYKVYITYDKALLKMASSYYAVLETTNPNVTKKLMNTFKDKERYDKESAKSFFKNLVLGDENVKSNFLNVLMDLASNIFAGGAGLSLLSAIDEKSDNFRILRSTNSILDNFYQLLLRSYNALDTSKSDKAKKAIIDNIVIKQLLGTNMFALDGQTYSTTENIVNMLESKDHYHVMLLGFKYAIIYMYCIWRNINPNSLVNYNQLDSENPDKVKIDEVIARDPAFTFVQASYPLTRANYKDVLAQIDLYGKSVNTVKSKEVWDDFLSFSVSQLTNVNATYMTKYLGQLNSSTTDKATRDTFGKFVTNLLPYFDKLYDDVLNNDLANLNPDASQYMIYDRVFMRERLEAMFVEHDVLQLMDKSYMEFILDVLMDNIVRSQQTRLHSTVINEDDTISSEKNLQVTMINKAINETVLRIASQLSSFDIKANDYEDYIMQKIFKSNPKSKLMVSAVNNALLQIDFQTTLAKKMTPSGSKEDERFVSPESFIQTIDDMRWTTFRQSLRIDELKVVVNSLRTDQIDMFSEDEYNLGTARIYFTSSVFLIIIGFILYFLMTHDPRKKGAEKNGRDKDATNDAENKSVLSIISGEFIKTGMPIALAILFLSVFNSYVQKLDTNIKFNRSQVTRNTNGLKTSISDFKDYLLKLDSKLSIDEKNVAISEIGSITEAEKINLYVDMRNILSTYDRCNYIIGAGKSDLPFPYAEVIADGFMVMLVAGSIIYVLIKFAPLDRLSELKDLYEYREASDTLASDTSFIQEITTRLSIHKETLESIMTSVKLISAVAVVVFVLVYSVKVNTSTTLYASGLQNSKYAQHSKCCS